MPFVAAITSFAPLLGGCEAPNPNYNPGQICEVPPSARTPVEGWFTTTPRPVGGLSIKYVDGMLGPRSGDDRALMGVGCAPPTAKGNEFGIVAVSAGLIDFSFTNGRQQISFLVQNVGFAAPGSHDKSYENRAYLRGEVSATNY